MAEAAGPQDQAKNRDSAGRFLPGASGNPGGRPQGSVSLRERLRRRLEDVAQAGGADLGDRLLDEFLAIALTRRRVSPAVRERALEFLFEQLEGKARASVDVNDVSDGWLELVGDVQRALREGPDGNAPPATVG